MTHRIPLAALALLVAGSAALGAPASPAPGLAHGAGRVPGEVVRVDHRDPAALPSRGPHYAPVTIELFFTPGPQSRVPAYRAIERLADRHPTRIRVIYRILGGNGQARLPFVALEAQAEGKFFELMDALNSARSTVFSDAQLLELARRVGLDPERVIAAMTDPPPAYRRLLEDNDRRRKQKIRGSALPNALFNGRLPELPLAGLGSSDLERTYAEAKARADDLLDRGADPRALERAFDEESAPDPRDIVVQPGQTDDEPDLPVDPPLARPPLDLTGLPSFGPADAPVVVVVLCSPTSPNCRAPLRAAKITQDLYPDHVRLVWLPYFDVSDDNAADLALLGDAALCAEQVGTSTGLDFDSPASAGWRWVEALLVESTSRHRRVGAEGMIDAVASRLSVDRAAFATCRANLAGTTLARIEAARHAGVSTTPMTVVGGRIYGPITDWRTLQLLVEAELAPGLLGVAAPSWRHPDGAASPVPDPAH